MPDSCSATWAVDGSGVIYRCQKPAHHPAGRHEYNGNGWHVYWFGQRGVRHLAEHPIEQAAGYDGSAPDSN